MTIRKMRAPSGSVFEALRNLSVRCVLTSFTPGAFTAFRSGGCRGIGHAGKNMPCPSSAMSSGRLFLNGSLASVARLRFTGIIRLKRLPRANKRFSMERYQSLNWLSQPRGQAHEVTMWRSTFGVPFWHSAYGFIALHPYPKYPPLDFTRDLQRLRTHLINEQRSGGMLLRSERVLTTPGGPAACFQFSRNDDVNIACYVFNGMRFTMHYDGNRRFAEDIYGVITSARPSEKNSAR